MNQAGASKQSLVMEQAGTRFFFWMVIHSAFLIPVKVLMQMTVSPERKHLEELRCFIVVRVCSIFINFQMVKERCFSNAKCFFLLSNKYLHVENRLCSCFFSPDLLRKQKATSQSG